MSQRQTRSESFQEELVRLRWRRREDSCDESLNNGVIPNLNKNDSNCPNERRDSISEKLQRNRESLEQLLSSDSIRSFASGVPKDNGEGQIQIENEDQTQRNFGTDFISANNDDDQDSYDFRVLPLTKFSDLKTRQRNVRRPAQLMKSLLFSEGRLSDLPEVLQTDKDASNPYLVAPSLRLPFEDSLPNRFAELESTTNDIQPDSLPNRPTPLSRTAVRTENSTTNQLSPSALLSEVRNLCEASVERERESLETTQRVLGKLQDLVNRYSSMPTTIHQSQPNPIFDNSISSERSGFNSMSRLSENENINVNTAEDQAAIEYPSGAHMLNNGHILHTSMSNPLVDIKHNSIRSWLAEEDHLWPLLEQRVQSMSLKYSQSEPELDLRVLEQQPDVSNDFKIFSSPRQLNSSGNTIPDSSSAVNGLTLTASEENSPLSSAGKPANHPEVPFSTPSQSQGSETGYHSTTVNGESIGSSSLSNIKKLMIQRRHRRFRQPRNNTSGEPIPPPRRRQRPSITSQESDLAMSVSEAPSSLSPCCSTPPSSSMPPFSCMVKSEPNFDVVIGPSTTTDPPLSIEPNILLKSPIKPLSAGSKPPYTGKSPLSRDYSNSNHNQYSPHGSWHDPHSQHTWAPGGNRLLRQQKINNPEHSDLDYRSIDRFPQSYPGINGTCSWGAGSESDLQITPDPAVPSFFGTFSSLSSYSPLKRNAYGGSKGSLFGRVSGLGKSAKKRLRSLRKTFSVESLSGLPSQQKGLANRLATGLRRKSDYVSPASLEIPNGYNLPKVLSLNADGTQTIQLIRNGVQPFGFYIAKASNDSGILISRIAQGPLELLYSGLLCPGDRVIELNGKTIHGHMNMDEIYDEMARENVLIMKILPTH